MSHAPTSKLIHQEGLNSALHMFGIELEDYKNLVISQNSIDPTTLIKAGLKKQNISLKPFNLAISLIDSALTRDPQTGFYDKKLGPLIYATADLYAYQKNKTAHIVEIDIANMGGGNDAIGKKKVDRAVRIMNQHYINALNEAGKGIEDFSITPVRNGGDEMRFVITGLDTEAINRALLVAQAQNETFVHEIGLDKLNHRKETKANDKTARGFSDGAAVVELGKGKSSSQLQGKLDGDIFFDKAERGKLRSQKSQLNINEQIINLLFKNLEDEELFSYANPTKEPKTLLERATKQAAEIALNSDQSDIEREKIDDFDNPILHYHIETKLLEYEKKLDLQKAPIQSPPWNMVNFPINENNRKDLNYDSEELRLDAVIKTATEHNFTSKETTILQNIANFYNYRDPCSGLKSNRDFQEDFQRYTDIINNDKENTTEPHAMLEFNLENLSGCNTEMNHAEADNIIRLAAQTINAEFEKDFSSYIYHIAGGRFRILSHGETMQHIANTAIGASNIFAELANSLTFENNTRLVGEIQNESRRGTDQAETQTGVGLVFGAIDMNGQRDLLDSGNITRALTDYTEAFRRDYTYAYSPESLLTNIMEIIEKGVKGVGAIERRINSTNCCIGASGIQFTLYQNEHNPNTTNHRDTANKNKSSKIAISKTNFIIRSHDEQQTSQVDNLNKKRSAVRPENKELPSR